MAIIMIQAVFSEVKATLDICFVVMSNLIIIFVVIKGIQNVTWVMNA